MSLLASRQALAQTFDNGATSGSTYADQSNPLGPQGPQAPQSVWSVDQASGALHVKIPLNTIPKAGRGPQIPYILQYNSNSLLTLSQPSAFTVTYSEDTGTGNPVSSGTSVIYHFNWVVGKSRYGPVNPNPVGPWTATYGPRIIVTENTGRAYAYQFGGYTQNSYTDCQSRGPYLYADETGQVHDLNLSITWATGGASSGPSCPTPAAVNTQANTLDGSNIAAVITGYQSSGVGNSIGAGAGTPGILQPLLDPEGRSIGDNFIEDSNGNYITAASGGLQDAQGRTLVNSPLGTGSTDIASGTYTLKTQGPNGADQPYTITVASFSPTFQFSMPHPTVSEVAALGGQTTEIDQNISDSNSGATVNNITGIQLPNSNGYSFAYDPVYGTMSKISFPQGGYVRFTWKIRPVGTRALGSQVTIQAQSTLVVSDVYVSDGINPENHSHYDYTDMDVNTGNLVTTEMEPDGTVIVYTNSPNNYSNLYHETQATWMETLRQTTSSSGTPLRAISTVYAKTPGGAYLPSQVATTYLDAPAPQQQQVSISYDKYNNIVEKDESDFYSCSTAAACTNTPPWLRKTSTAYLWQQNPTYETAHIVNKPVQVTIADGSGTVFAQTSYGYDEFPLAGGTGIVNHDDAGFPASKQTGRGNLTTVSRCATFNSGNCAQLLSTTYKYDVAGQRISEKDPAGNETKYSYADQYAAGTPAGPTDAYVTQIVYANGTLERRSYNYYDGSAASSTDVNGQTTSYAYADSLGRLTAVNYPDGGSTATNYNGDPVPSKVTTRIATGEQAGPVQRTVSYDGLGRTVKAQLITDPLGAVTVDTAYDGNGRVASVSNPYRATDPPAGQPGSTRGSTSYVYDGLDRIAKKTDADGVATQTYTWAGNKIDFKNENSYDWQRTYDALGNLSSVVEPDDSNKLTYRTDYQYDVLGNLKQVDQWGGPQGNPGDRVRSFAYDGLSRLRSATNPESGTVAYSYDPNGNVQSKTDARGVTTSFQYDVLNRLTSKSYANDPAGTPGVSYVYDTAIQGWNFVDQTSPALSGIHQTYLLGRLSYAQSGQVKTVYGYDPLGRTTLKSVCTPTTCGTDHYDLHASYDLAGNTVFADRGLDAVRNAASPNAGFYYGGLSMAYSGAGQMTSGTADIVDATHPASIVSGLLYSPLGGMTAAAFGGVYSETDQYTSRGWLSSRTGTIDATGYARTGTLMHDLAGNVTQQSDTLTNSTATYVPDRLNRLTSFSNVFGAATYGYDAWGNLTSHTNTAGSGYTYTLAMTPQNRVSQAGSTDSAFSYDASGNVLTDGLNNYSWDAEGRLAAVNGSTTYVYGPEGERTATLQNGSVTAEYLYGMNGTLITELAPGGTLVRGLVYGGGMHLADYTKDGKTVFHLSDEVGSLVNTIDQTGAAVESCAANPFGEGLGCSPSVDYTENHFTDKKRDQESGLDSFGARYYGSTFGRFMSPDFSDSGSTPDPVPYADFTNPQSLNLYSYAFNNPLTNTDSDGHLPCGGSATISITVTPNGASESQTPDCEFSQSVAFGQLAQGVFIGVGNSFASAANFIDQHLNNGQNQESLQPTNGINQQRGAMIGQMGMLFVPGADGAEGFQLLSREQLLARVSNPKLKNIVSFLYREGATIGDGSTAAAIEHELETGEMVGGRTHTIKGRDSIRALQRVLREQDLSPGERDVANYLIGRLSKALGMGGAE